MLNLIIPGQWFIGGYLIHAFDDVVYEASNCLQKVFLNNTPMRLRYFYFLFFAVTNFLSIINGFLNFIKVSPHQDDASICTMVTQLSMLISLWSSSPSLLSFVVESDILYRVSCKLDSAMLVLLGRPNSKIRHSCLKILADFYLITETSMPHSKGAGYLPLHAIITQADTQISRYAVYAYLEQEMGGDILVSDSTELSILSFMEVALSNYSGLFLYYLGELVRQFVVLGRVKALRHCVKLLKIVAISHMTSAVTVTKEFIATYSSYLVLLMGLAGVPDKSEVLYTLNMLASTDQTLYTYFNSFLPPV